IRMIPSTAVSSTLANRASETVVPDPTSRISGFTACKVADSGLKKQMLENAYDAASRYHRVGTVRMKVITGGRADCSASLAACARAPSAGPFPPSAHVHFPCALHESLAKKSSASRLEPHPSRIASIPDEAEPGCALDSMRLSHSCAGPVFTPG